MDGSLADTAPGATGVHASPDLDTPLDAHRLRMYRGSFLLVILTESLGFLTLFSVRFLLAGLGRPAELNGVLGIMITLAFAGSAVPAVWALRAIRAGDREAMVFRLDVALGLGLAAFWFVVADLSSSTIAPASRFGGIYFATIGFHAIHILVGLVFLAALRSSGRRGRFNAANHWLVEAGVRFWLFVVAAWLAVYIVFYWL
ncbi:MAG: heme-copper oxidase subunit III [Candidatus Limnocylindria bacterium]